jgi:hypothetical protein
LRSEILLPVAIVTGWMVVLWTFWTLTENT